MNSNIRQMYPIGQMFFIPQLMKLQNNSIHYELNEEVFTGNYWIDGKPIYRKIIETISSASNSWKIIATINNLEYLVSINGFIYSTKDYIYYPLNYCDNSTFSFTTIDKNGKIRNKTSYTNIQNCQMKLIVEYTKTVD